MPRYQTVAFTLLELKGLWVRATGGKISAQDPLLHQAAENAIDKVYRRLRGMGKRPTPPKVPRRGPPLELQRGDPGSLRFDFPLPPNPNQGGGQRWGQHWAAGRKQKEKYWELLDTFVTLKRLPRAPRRPWARAQGTARVRTCPIMDQDNAEARLKWVWDWLESRGYLENDRAVRCDVAPEASPRKDQGVTLTLEEVPDGPERQ